MRRILSVTAVLLVLLVLLVGSDALLWRWAQLQLDAAFTAFHPEGWTVTAAPGQRGGWPLAATLSMTDLFVAGHGVMTWSADRLTLTASLLHPTVLTIAADGMQRLKLGDLPEIGYTADRLDANVKLEPGVPVRQISLHAANLRAGQAGEAGGTTVTTLSLSAEWAPQEFIMGLQAQGIGLPPARNWPFGPRLAALTLDASIGGPFSSHGDLTDRATAWRDGGGTVAVHQLAVRWGRLDAAATATIAFDQRMQPSGTGIVRVIEPSGALAELVANGALADRAAFAANAMLALMTHASPDGSAAAVELPLAVQNQRLSIGQIPLTKLPLMTLPTAP